MGQGYLIDTNCIIDFAGGKLPDRARNFLEHVIDGGPFISVINKIEILGFSDPGEEVINFLNNVLVIGLSDDIVEETISIRRKHRIKLPDAIIAATALRHDIKLVTRNTYDFRMIEGVKLVNPWEQ